MKRPVIQRKRWAVKQRAIDYKGGCCSECGYDRCIRALVFHHLDPKEKDFGVSEFINNNLKNWDIIQRELDKCVLLCSNCHQEVHAGIRILSTCSVTAAQQPYSLFALD